MIWEEACVMLGLLAHGLHLLPIVLGAVGVGALLLPRVSASRSRAMEFRTPATLDEHEQRVAELRTAVRSGRLTAPRLADHRPAEWPGGRDPSPWRAVAAFSSLAAAVVHAEVFPHHLEQGLLVGAFFFVAAAAQAIWAFQVVQSATLSRLVAGAVGNLVLIGVWAVSRTVGLPFGLGREPVGAWDVAAVTWQLCVVVACVVGLRTSADDHCLPLGRLGLRTWVWVLASVSALAFLSLTVPHE
jgi:hypothetical protein